MAIINNLDLGAHSTWQIPISTRKGTEWGSETQTLVVETGQSIIWSRAGKIRTRTETIWVLGGTSTAALQKVRQLQELSANPNLQPVYIQWASGGGVLVADPEDGWYTLESVVPDEEVTVDGVIPVQIQVSYTNPGINSQAGSKGIAMSYFGSDAHVGYTPGSLPTAWAAYPTNATAGTPSNAVSRTTADGNVVFNPSFAAGVVSPQLIASNGVIADLFRGRVYCFDVININTNPVPTNGNFINSNWVEVLHPDHLFLGDCIITNGIILLDFPRDLSNNIAHVFGWNLVTNQWLEVVQLSGSNDSFSASWILYQIGLQKISHSEISIKLGIFAGNIVAQIIIRLTRGQPFFRVQLTPLTETVSHGLYLTIQAGSQFSRICTETKALDPNLTAEQSISMPVVSDYGWVAGFRNNTALPFIYGFHILDSTNLAGQGSTASTAAFGTGDSSRPLINQSRYYGVFVVPFSQPDRLQAEAEAGTLGTGWSNTPDAAASGGATAKVASGTAAGNADLFGTSTLWTPNTLGFHAYFRVKVTNNTGNTGEMQLGVWDVTASSFIGSTTYAANAFQTTYTWVQVLAAAGNNAPSGHNTQFRAVTAGTLGTDWFIDEAFLMPVYNFPQAFWTPRETWLTFAQDMTMKLVPV